eukprot:gnl/Dysnectes_brevis/9434_a17538_202.p1 GENE.gnl/Dysnectes_brevis/9434_a17538_202~~gnl/Dysnectes_brevis/9434_a17538_202.p1  ORF type:complete len:129 (+),score=6.37 gnl/Dysnectes_brevis/9434_a17538_202:127-513(+)
MELTLDSNYTMVTPRHGHGQWAAPEPAAEPVANTMNQLNQTDPDMTKHSFFSDVRNGRTPELAFWLSIVCLIINIFLPGFGTLLASIRVCSGRVALIGLLQFLLTIILIGWIWSIIYGLLLVRHSKRG